VRRGDDNAIGKAFGASAVMDENRARNHRRRGEPVVALNNGLDAVCCQDLERGALRRPESACVSLPI
jgi:hypothetical protein